MAMADAIGAPDVALPRRIGRRSVASWVLHDLANTCFSLGVVTPYFPGIVRNGIPVLGWPPWLICPVGALVGVALAGLWASDRPLMARLAPPRYYGEFFGLYAMVGRFGAVVGPAVWVLVATKALLNWGQPAAVMFLLLWMVIASLVLRRVDDRPRAWGPEDLPELAPGSREPAPAA